jgi:hypothetical protein
MYGHCLIALSIVFLYTNDTRYLKRTAPQHRSPLTSLIECRDATHMVIIPRYELSYNDKKMEWTVISRVESACPYCFAPLTSYDSRRRSGIKSSGEKLWYRIRRLRCSICGKIHTELPDFLLPYKHYEVDVIQGEIEGITPSCCAADDSTIRIWRSQWERSLPQLFGALASLQVRFVHHIPPLTKGGSLISQIRSSGEERWLPFVIRQLIGGGFPIYTKFAFCP